MSGMKNSFEKYVIAKTDCGQNEEKKFGGRFGCGMPMWQFAATLKTIIG